MTVTALVRVLDEDPDLAAGLDARTLALARRDLVAEVIERDAGQAPVDRDGAAFPEDALGLLVLDGLLVRRVELLGRFGVELIGAGDVVRPWGTEDGFASVPATESWRVLERASIAVLDESFAEAVGRFPQVMQALFHRSARRADVLSHHLALTQLPRIESRLLVVLWQLADRWGRATSEGVVLPLALSHSTLGELVSAARPTVTSGLKLLAAEGHVLWRREAGVWLLRGRPPARSARNGDGSRLALMKGVT